MSKRRSMASLLAGSAVLLGALWLRAGPLNPPAGPVASTYKTLGEVEPRIAVNATNTPGDSSHVYVIRQPGSYYLTNNVAVPSQMSGIGIASAGVTLDLGGFSILGVTDSNSGILVDVAANVTIQNGAIQGVGQWGVQFQGTSGHLVLRGLMVSGCAGGGFVGGDPATIIDCAAISNGGFGFTLGSSATLERCQSNSNQYGFQFNAMCTLLDCRADGNSVYGFAETGGGPVSISDCTASNNGQWGFTLHDDSMIRGSVALSNGLDGFSAGDRVTITNCQSNNNTGRGFALGSAPLITNSSASGNHSDGVSVGGRATITDCQSNGNTTAGFSLASDSSILDSTASDNGGDGIVGAQSNRVRRCSVRGSSPNGQYGIHLTGSANFVEGNSVIAARVGIEIDSGGNKLIRNVCSANLNNWYVQVGNYCYVTVGQATLGQISGNSGGSPSGATDPDANFSY